jgi:hypothetical protein
MDVLCLLIPIHILRYLSECVFTAFENLDPFNFCKT